MPRVRLTIAWTTLATVLVACSSATSQSPAAVASAAGTSAAATATPPTGGPLNEVIAAVEATVDEGTVRVDQTLEFQDSTLVPDGTSATARGQATLSPPQRLRVRADFSALGVGRLVLIRDDSLVYMRGAAFERLSGKGRWLVVDLESDHPAAVPFRSLTTGQNDVSMALYYLYGATDDVEVSAGELIAGQATLRYDMELDLEAARDVIPAGQAEGLEDVIAALRVAGIERQLDGVAWVGEDGLVHRVQYTYRLGRTAGGGSMVTVIDFDEFGSPLELGIPRDRDVVSIEDVAANSTS